MVDSIGLQLMFCNTYHLLLQPGPDVIRRAGGLHKFINRQMPIITDSGGFQVFSLAYGSVADELKSRGAKKAGWACVENLAKRGSISAPTETARRFCSRQRRSVQTQKALGADIIIPFDELPPYHIGSDQLKLISGEDAPLGKALFGEHLKNRQEQAMYAVIHGGVDPELRRESCETF